MPSGRFAPRGMTLEPTPRDVYLNRRQLLAGLGLGLVGAAGANCQTPGGDVAAARSPLDVPLSRPGVFPPERNAAFRIPEGIAPTLTPRETAAVHNNFYEFLPGRGGPVWEHTADFEVEPWKVEVKGLCARPRTFDLDDLFAFPHEERLYHFRCVERWAMNVPWSGFPLSALLERVEPTADATHVRFVSAAQRAQMPGLREADYYEWPYHEGLRLDEAMHPLTLVATGIYGEPLLKQHGAPVRVVVPWKYGYKSPKSIVEIELVAGEPRTFWQRQPHEYGFLSNVNPNIPHPRWSQAESWWLRNEERFPTQIWNGYGEWVAELYPDEPRKPQRPLRPGEIAR